MPVPVVPVLGRLRVRDRRHGRLRSCRLRRLLQGRRLLRSRGLRGSRSLRRGGKRRNGRELLLRYWRLHSERLARLLARRLGPAPLLARLLLAHWLLAHWLLCRGQLRPGRELRRGEGLRCGPRRRLLRASALDHGGDLLPAWCVLAARYLLAAWILRRVSPLR